MRREVEREVADALLDTGVSVPFLRIGIPLRKRPLTVRLTMRRPCLGSQIRLARHYLRLGCTWDEMERFDRDRQTAFLARHGRRLSLMLALTVCRGPLSGAFWAVPLAWLIRRYMPHEYIMGASVRFLSLLGTRSFTSIIRSVEAINPLRPRLSLTSKGS